MTNNGNTAENQTKALLASVVSMAIAYRNLIGKPATDPDERVALRVRIEALLGEETPNPDPSCWALMKSRMLYDVFLEMREEEGTITPTDLARPGIVRGLFSDEEAYLKHALRVSESRRKGAVAAEEKECSACGKTKHRSKFKKGRGTVCTACVGAAYRKRVKDRVTDDGDQSCP